MNALRNRRAPALLLFILFAVAAPAPAQSVAWWRSEQFQKEIGMTTEQRARIDNVYQSALPELRLAKQELDRLQTELSTLIEADSDEALVLRQLDRVEASRGQLNKRRTVMLLHMRQVLTPEQRARFKSAHDQWERDHRREGRERPRGSRK